MTLIMTIKMAPRESSRGALVAPCPPSVCVHRCHLWTFGEHIFIVVLWTFAECAYVTFDL